VREFKEKVTPSIGGGSEASTSLTKPMIVFRKRKAPRQVNFRRVIYFLQILHINFDLGVYKENR